MMKSAATPISQIVPQSAAWIPARSASIEVKLLMKSNVSVPAPSSATSTSSTTSRPSASARQVSIARRKTRSFARRP
jgi:hypothetical protein